MDSGDLFEKLCFFFGPELKDCISPEGQLLADSVPRRHSWSGLLCSFKPALILWLRSSQRVSHRVCLLTDREDLVSRSAQEHLENLRTHRALPTQDDGCFHIKKMSVIYWSLLKMTEVSESLKVSSQAEEMRLWPAANPSWPSSCWAWLQSGLRDLSPAPAPPTSRARLLGVIHRPLLHSSPHRTFKTVTTSRLTSRIQRQGRLPNPEVQTEGQWAWPHQVGQRDFIRPCMFPEILIEWSTF